jgi:isopenicillin-N epimerase
MNPPPTQPTFLLDPEINFLNHGSFGATPRCVLQVQRELREVMEREPIDFMIRQLPERISQACEAVAHFIGSPPENTAFVQNATAGVNAVLSSVPLEAGCEILTTNHRYDAVRNTLQRAALAQGARVVEATVPFPISSSQEVTEAIEAAITPKTRLIIVDQITSPTALIFPVEELVQLARDRGIPILVDGAHAPGQIDLDLSKNPPDFWVGNLHKWLCAPKGSAVLVVRDEWRERIHPTVTSHGYGQGLHSEFHWCGTFDPTAWLTAPAAIELHQELGGAAFRAAHHRLVQAGRQAIAAALQVQLPHPDCSSLYGSMATIPIPCPMESTVELFNTLRTQDKIEVPIIPWQGAAWVRISGFAAYNRAEQYQELAAALKRRLQP